MNRSHALITSVFFASLAAAVGFASFGGNSKPTMLVPVSSDVPAQKAPGGTKIAWETSFENAMTRAKKENKPIFINFSTDWCGVCKQMDENVYPMQNVVEASQKWVMVKIDGDKRADVARAYGVTGFPTLVFAHNSGKPLEMIPGYADPNELSQLLETNFEKNAKAS